jgi:hypothetical protein
MNEWMWMAFLTQVWAFVELCFIFYLLFHTYCCRFFYHLEPIFLGPKNLFEISSRVLTMTTETRNLPIFSANVDFVGSTAFVSGVKQKKTFSPRLNEPLNWKSRAGDVCMYLGKLGLPKWSWKGCWVRGVKFIQVLGMCLHMYVGIKPNTPCFRQHLRWVPEFVISGQEIFSFSIHAYICTYIPPYVNVSLLKFNFN